MTEETIKKMRFFMYLRKSTKGDTRQAISIEAQLAEVTKQRVEALGLDLVAEPFQEKRTAKMPGRPVFNEMMSRVEQGEADGILCWNLDRLSRNPIDNGRLVWELGNEGNLKAVVTVDRIYGKSSEDRFMSALMLAMATKYVDVSRTG